MGGDAGVDGKDVAEEDREDVGGDDGGSEAGGGGEGGDEGEAGAGDSAVFEVVLGGEAGAPPSATGPFAPLAASAACCILLGWALSGMPFLAAGGGKAVVVGSVGGDDEDEDDKEEEALGLKNAREVRGGDSVGRCDDEEVWWVAGMGVGLALRPVPSPPAWGIISAGGGVGAGFGVSLVAVEGVVMVGLVMTASKACQATLSTEPTNNSSRSSNEAIPARSGATHAHHFIFVRSGDCCALKQLALPTVLYQMSKQARMLCVSACKLALQG